MRSLQISDTLVLSVAIQLRDRRLKLEANLQNSTLARYAPATMMVGRLLNEQPYLLACVLAATAPFSVGHRITTVFLTEVIFETFSSAGRASRIVQEDEFVEFLKSNRKTALLIAKADGRIAERYLRNSGALHQPALVRYVSGVLLDGHETCPHNLLRENLGAVFIILKTVIDILDQDTSESADGN